MDKIYVDDRIRLSRTHLFWVGPKNSYEAEEKVKLFTDVVSAYNQVGEGILFCLAVSRQMALLEGAVYSEEELCYFLDIEKFKKLEKVGEFLVLRREDEKVDSVSEGNIEINFTID